MRNIDKVLKAIGGSTKDEMDAMSADDLQRVIVQANNAMETVAQELDANDKFQDVCAKKTAMEQGKKDVNKRQKAKIQYALHRLGEMGEDLSEPQKPDADEAQG